MSVDISEQRESQSEGAQPDERKRRNAPQEPAPAAEPKPGRLESLAAGVRELKIAPILLYGTGAGLLMAFALLDPNSFFALLAGIIPVTAGLLLARSVPGHYGLHGFFTGLVAAAVSFITLAVLMFLTPFGPQILATGIGGTPAQELLFRGGLPAVMLLIFCTFGATTSGRLEDRNRQMRREIAERGGQLERPGAIRTPDDIRGLSLPQLGAYVNTLFKKKGFTFKDYRFTDKDKHLDLWLEHEGEPWHLRLSVADKITPGTVEGLLQEMKRENCRHGVVVTSTEFTPAAQKAAKGRPVALIDGPTLFEVAEG